MYIQDEGRRNGCIARGNERGDDGADHGKGIKFRVGTRSGKNFRSGIESFWNSGRVLRVIFRIR